MRGRTWIALVLAASLAACDASTHELVVNVRTDLAPGTAFDSVVVELYDERGTFGEQLRRFEERAVDGDDYVNGVQLVEVDGIEEGFYVIRVALMLGGDQVVDVLGPLEIDTDRVVTVDVSGACVGVTCPQAGDPSATVCVSGICAQPECLFAPTTPGCPMDVDAGTRDAGAADAGPATDAAAEDAGVDGGPIAVPPGYVYVPAGPFMMGCNPLLDTVCNMDELPQHEVTLDAYFIMQEEVSQTEWAACIADAVCPIPADGMEWTPMTTPDHPVVDITRGEAETYCNWADARLPTEAEWEKAARGTDARVYPWGNDPPTCMLANYVDCGDMRRDVTIHGSVPSPYGTINMAGNVWEWVSDFYAADYYASSPPMNPRGPATGTTWVIRGGSFDWPTTALRTSRRLEWENPTAVIGVRCARDVE